MSRPQSVNWRARDEDPEVTVAVDNRDELGECPVWDERAGQLLWVDVSQGIVRTWQPATGATDVTRYDRSTSAVVLRRSSPGWVVAVGRDLVIQEPGGRTVLATLDDDRPGNRLNDCKCDAQGRLWAGTLAPDFAPGMGSLYRIDPDGSVKRALSDVTLANGLAWSPTGETMYFIDTRTQRVDAFDFDAGPGVISGRRPLVRIDAADGSPDGMTVDGEGGLWVCLFRGGVVRRYAPTGELDVEVSLPVSIPTCPTFGGSTFDTVYVTTARRRLSPADREAEPLAGAMLALRAPRAWCPRRSLRRLAAQAVRRANATSTTRRMTDDVHKP